ncbi:translation factor [Chiua virens]|nr:translation factor [Chiua virens]
MSSSTQILKCDPSSIHFDSDGRPTFASPDTLAAITAASRHIHAHQPVAFPTETVYGLAALALDPDAASRIFTTKGRPADNPLIVHVSSQSMLASILPSNFTIPPSYQTLINAFWPGPLTLLFPATPPRFQASSPPVIPLSPSGCPAPSANSSGKPSPTRAEHVFRDLDGKIGLIIDGGSCDVGLESTVLDGLHQDGNIRVLRPGGITVEQIDAALKLARTGPSIPRVLVHRRDFVDDSIEQAPTTPGMKYRHYAPAVPVTLLRSSSQPPAAASSVSPSTFLVSLKSSMAENLPPKVGLLAPSESLLAKTLLEDSAIQWHRYSLGSLSEMTVIAHPSF